MTQTRFEPVCFLRLISLYVNKKGGNLGWLPIIKALFYCWTHESRLSPDSSPDSLWLLLDSQTRTRTLTHWTRTRTLVQWTRTRTRTLVQWTRTHTWWTRTLARWTGTRTRTLALWTRTHCRTHESGLTPTLIRLFISLLVVLLMVEGNIVNAWVVKGRPFVSRMR